MQADMQSIIAKKGHYPEFNCLPQEVVIPTNLNNTNQCRNKPMLEPKAIPL